MDAPTGVVFPLAGADRSTSAFGRAVVADALRVVDPIGARAAEGETNWRRGYLGHFRRLVEAGVSTPEAGRTIAADGLASLHSRMRYIGPDRLEVGVADIFATGAAGRSGHGAAGIDTVTVAGKGEIDQELS